jgi:hypothetical protein
MSVIDANGQIAVQSTRTLAMVHAAAHDALNAINRRYDAYYFEGPGDAAASRTPPWRRPPTPCSSASSAASARQRRGAPLSPSSSRRIRPPSPGSPMARPGTRESWSDARPEWPS